MAWDVMSGVTKMAWDVMSGVTKTAWGVLSGVANLCGMFCPGCKKMAWDVLSRDVLSGSPSIYFINEPRHGISINVVCGTSKGSDQPAHTRSLIRAFACHLNIP